MKWNSEDTIAAIATPAGIGGIGIIRLSGKNAVSIVDTLFHPAQGGTLAKAGTHRMIYGLIKRDGEPLDEVMAVFMKAPRSYTREDVVELQCHGGPLVLRTVLDLVCQKGARLAEPGEFTLRALFNGRMDLTQVEAVNDIIRSRSLGGLKVSANQLLGRLHTAIAALMEEISQVAALVAAGIDFPDEEIVFAHGEEIARRLEICRERLGELVDSAETGRILREGLQVAIVGKPNVGKSSLLNSLLRENRAIVSDIPGTTRDTLEESIELGGVLLNLVDTAGIRKPDNRIEQEGITRSYRAMEQAELVLLMLDGTKHLSQEDNSLLDKARPDRTLVVINKQDLISGQGPAWEERLDGMESVRLSSLTGEGLEGLEKWIGNWVFRENRPKTEQVIITNLRQKQAAQQALSAVISAQKALQEGVGDELMAIDLQGAMDALGNIVGETTTDDLLNRIFSEFCIGK